MTERLSGETLLRSDGDIVPPDDIPDAEDLPKNEDIIKNMILAGEVEQAEAQEELSDAYRGVVALIEAGIEDTAEGASYTVKFDGQELSLGEFLAGPLFRMDLPDEERKAILDTYVPIDLAHEAALDAEAVEVAADNDFQAYYDLYDTIEAKSPGGPAEIHRLTQAEALRRGVAIPPDL